MPVYLCVWVWEREAESERVVGWGQTGGDEIKRLTYTFDPECSFRLSTVGFTLLPQALWTSENGCYTCQTNPMQICTGSALTVTLKVYVCGETAVRPNVTFYQVVAVSQVLGICFLPLFITVLLKEACERDHCSIGPNAWIFFYPLRFLWQLYTQSIWHAQGAIQTIQEC